MNRPPLFSYDTSTLTMEAALRIVFAAMQRGIPMAASTYGATYVVREPQAYKGIVTYRVGLYGREHRGADTTGEVTVWVGGGAFRRAMEDHAKKCRDVCYRVSAFTDLDGQS